MPQWKQYSGTWPLQTQMQAVADGTWTGIILDNLYAAGYNTPGNLGINNIIERSSPVQVGSDGNWSSISCGSNQTVSIKSDGTLWAWGNNGVGDLGVNDVIYRSSPVQVGALTTWTKAVTVARATFAIKNDGTLWSWGWGANGRLGQNSTVDYSSPVQIGAGTDWAYIEGRFAIKTNGTLWAIGSNGFGQLGTGNTTTYSSPVQIGALTDWESASSISLASFFIKTDGTLWSVGYNFRGQLGQNISYQTHRSSPVQVGALTTWAFLSRGNQNGSFGVAGRDDGTLWSWGYNERGQLGLDIATNINRSSPVQIGALTDWESASHNTDEVYAVKTDGTLWAWGFNTTGALAQNDRVARSSPIQIGSSTQWTLVSAGGGEASEFWLGINRTQT